MSTANNVDSGDISIPDKVDPDTLRQIFGTPTNPVKPEGTHTANEHASNSYPMTNPHQPLLATSNDRNEPLSGPELDEQSKNSVPEINSGPPPPIDNHYDNIEGNNKRAKRETTLALDKPANQGKVHFKWWKNIPPPDQGESGVESRFGELFPPTGGTNPQGAGNAPLPEGGGNGTLQEPDVNAYQHRKNLAHGMMDLALLSANATQLRTVLEAPAHPYYYPGVVFVSLSIILQVTVGLLLILNSRFDVTNLNEIHHAIKVNDFTVAGVFLVTIINVFIASFIGTSPPIVASGQAG